MSAYRSRLMAVAGHDLRQPLQVVSMVLDRVQLQVTDPALRGRVELAQKSIDTLSEGLDSLAKASRLDDDLGEPRRERFPVREMFQAVLETWSPQAEEKGLDLRVVGCSMLVESDRGMLTSIVSNLVGNAIKYTDKGAVLLGCRRRGNKLAIEVVDTGIGMTPAWLDHAFEPFRQLDRTKDGLGLGLTIVRRTADLLGHAVRVDSVLGKGSRFAVEVPLAAVSPASLEREGVAGMV